MLVGIDEKPSLKEFLQNANNDLDREEEMQEQASVVSMEHQVFEKEYDWFDIVVYFVLFS